MELTEGMGQRQRRACQLLLAHIKLEITVRCLGIEADFAAVDALSELK